MDHTEEPLVLTVEAAAKLLQVSRGHAYEMARNGTLPVLKLGRRLLIRRQALLRMLDDGVHR